MKIRAVTDIATFEKVVDLEIDIWGVDDRDAAPANILHAITENGGVTLVAEEDERLVGLCLGIPARKEKEHYLWSHMTGVHPDYQNQGIGYALKLAQRDWAVAHGYNKICWTFDPLQRGNANFNIHRLGARSTVYHVDYYGEMTNGINAGLPSDRLEAVWLLDQKASAASSVADADLSQDRFLIYSDALGRPHQSSLSDENSIVAIEIPASIAELKADDPQLALEWRLAVRESMQTAFAARYSVIDFVTSGSRCAYLMAAPAPWFMYVLRCSDNSLYTGITLDIERRIRQHNAGKGAAYTAARRPVSLLAIWRFPDHGSALKAEAAFKKNTRHEKLRLVGMKQRLYNGIFFEME